MIEAAAASQFAAEQDSASHPPSSDVSASLKWSSVPPPEATFSGLPDEMLMNIHKFADPQTQRMMGSLDRRTNALFDPHRQKAVLQSPDTQFMQEVFDSASFKLLPDLVNMVSEMPAAVQPSMYATAAKRLEGRWPQANDADDYTRLMAHSRRIESRLPDASDRARVAEARKFPELVMTIAGHSDPATVLALSATNKQARGLLSGPRHQVISDCAGRRADDVRAAPIDTLPALVQQIPDMPHQARPHLWDAAADRITYAMRHAGVLTGDKVRDDCAAMEMEFPPGPERARIAATRRDLAAAMPGAQASPHGRLIKELSRAPVSALEGFLRQIAALPELEQPRLWAAAADRVETIWSQPFTRLEHSDSRFAENHVRELFPPGNDRERAVAAMQQPPTCLPS